MILGKHLLQTSPTRALDRIGLETTSGREEGWSWGTGLIGSGTIEEATPPYFAVSLLKLCLMSVSTLGLYQLWWFYKNWCRIKRREESNISPAWRAIFSPIWCYACFARVRASATSLNLHAMLPAGPLALAWFITVNLWRLPHPYWFVSYLSFVWFLPVQAVANRINSIEVPSHDPNQSFNAGEIAIVIFGSFIMVLAYLGSMKSP
jgi:hypothetical protein